MAGVGSFPAGATLAGTDGPGVTTIRALTRPARAILWDPSTRTFPTDSNGAFLDIHPVDQAVALALTQALTSVRSASTVGTDWSSLSRKTGGALQKAAEDVARASLDPWVRSGDITILGITAVAVVRGNNQVEVDYMNNRTSQRRTVKSG